MTDKIHGRSLHKTGRKKTLRKPPNTGIVEEFPSKESSRTENPFRKMWIFLPESSEKSGKIMDTERKISHTVRKKLENDSKGEGKMPGNGKRKPKKQAFPSKRIQEKHWKNGNGMKKFLSTGQKNIPMKRKNLENGWSGWKNNRAFFAGRQQKNAGKEAGRNQKIYQAYPEKAWKTYGWQG